MEIGAVIERVERIAAVRANAAADCELIEAGLVVVREVTAWADADQAALVRQLASKTSFPEAASGEHREDLRRSGSQSKDRADTLDRTPNLAGRLGDGAITAGHVDAVTRCSKQLDEQQRRVSFDRVDQLADVAAAATVDEFAKRVRLEATRRQADDGLDTSRTPEGEHEAEHVGGCRRDGGNLRGRFDPVTGVELAAKLDGAVETLFAGAGARVVPGRSDREAEIPRSSRSRAAVGRCGERQTRTTGAISSWSMRTHRDRWGRSGVVDPGRRPRVWVLAELAGDADVTAVVVRNGVVLHAPGELNLGRMTRLANRAQRRALRALYSTCAIPGCTVGYDRCELHHIVWWRNGGLTDLENLVPICSKHHGRIHNDGWTIELGPNRQLTLRLPDGAIHSTGPPGRRTTA